MTDDLDISPDSTRHDAERVAPDAQPSTSIESATDLVEFVPGSSISAGLIDDDVDRLIDDHEFDSGPTPLVERVWRRIVRRPADWARRPWPNDRIMRFVVTVFSLTATTAVMLNLVHLNPISGDNLVFKDTTPTGGDFGAHVWGPAYLRDHLLPSGWFNGWSMDCTQACRHIASTWCCRRWQSCSSTRSCRTGLR
jgi:hypothetical protein